MADVTDPHGEEGGTRRDFLDLVMVSGLGLVAAGVAWPLLDSMNPAADTLALATIEVDIESIEVGQSVTVKWRGKPVFIRRRSAEEIAQAEDTPLADLPDPQTDAERVIESEWLVLVGVCTHLGCIPKGQKAIDDKGDYNGWFCPCHGSHYDTSGRVRKGPAPRNLEIPEYEFLEETRLRIG